MPRFGIQWLEEFHKEHNISVLDLRNCCGPNGDDLVLSFDKGHLNPKGCSVVAQAAAQKLASFLQ